MKYFIHLPMKMEPIVSSETSAIRTQTPGNYPKRNKLHLEHGESLNTKKLLDFYPLFLSLIFSCYFVTVYCSEFCDIYYYVLICHSEGLTLTNEMPYFLFVTSSRCSRDIVMFACFGDECV